MRAFNGPVELLEVPEPRQVARDEVLVHVKAAGVGNWDEVVRIGRWDAGRTPPMALGVEAAGVIADLGEDVTDVRRGDAVMTHPLPLRDQGTWAPRVIAPTALVAPKPADATWEAAAALPVPALTAAQALDALELAPGESVLVHGAGGVTGGLMVTLAVERGAQVYATAGPASHARAVALGAREVFDYHDDRWPDDVRRATGGRGVSAAANATRNGAATAIRAVVDGGRLATITSDPVGGRGIKVADVYVRADGQQLRRLSSLLGQHRFDSRVAATYQLTEAGVALAQAKAGHAGGASVLTIDG